MRYGHWYNILIGIKGWHRYAISLLSSIVILLLWLILFYLPLHKEIMVLRMQAQQCEKDLTTCVNEQELCKKLKEQVNQLKHELRADCAQGEATLEGAIALVVKQLESSQLQVGSIKKGQLKQKDWYETVPISIQAKGTLLAIHHFFAVLEKNDQLIQCCECLIEHEKDAQYRLCGTLKFCIPKKDA